MSAAAAAAAAATVLVKSDVPAGRAEKLTQSYRPGGKINKLGQAGLNWSKATFRVTNFQIINFAQMAHCD